MELPGVVKAPLSFTANFRATDQVIGIDGIRGQLSSGRVSGAVAIDTSGTKPAANANLNFDRLELLPAPASRPASPRRAVEQPADGSRGASRVRRGGENVGARARGRHDSHRSGRDRGEPVGRAVVVASSPARTSMAGRSRAGSSSMRDRRDPRYGPTLDLPGERPSIPHRRPQVRQYRRPLQCEVRSHGVRRQPRRHRGEPGRHGRPELRGRRDPRHQHPRHGRTLSNQTLQGWQEKGPEQTEFGSFFAKFQMANGKATSDDIRLVGPLVRMTGKGTRRPGGRTLDFRVDPKLVLSQQGQGSANDPAGLGVPVVIRGSWDNPQIYPDISGILDNPEAAFTSSRRWAAACSACRAESPERRDRQEARRPMSDQVARPAIPGRPERPGSDRRNSPRTTATRCATCCGTCW